MRSVGAWVEGVPHEDLDAVTETYLDSGGEFLVGTVEGDIVAMGAFRPADGGIAGFFDSLREPTAEIKRMRVDSALQRRGYGSELYAELEARARDRGFAELILDTGVEQDGARRFYERRGFEAEDFVQVEAFGKRFDLALYRKRLDD